MKLLYTVIVAKVIIAVICLFSSLASAWDNGVTHKDLSRMAAANSIIGTTDYLKNIGLADGLLHFLVDNSRGQELYEWLREGADLEDAGSDWQGFIGTARYANHFHNPLKPWGSAGLDDTVMSLSYRGKSTLLWAQYGSWQEPYPQGDWSWKKTRDHFYLALTANNDADKQAGFAATFRGLGHQIHLIQDMSVPAHVRNDAHPEDPQLEFNRLTGDYYFESWAKKHSDVINAFGTSPLYPAVALNVNRVGLAPISQFIDAEQYSANVVPNNSLKWGLSEYTNANFVSDDTIFTESFNTGDRHYFPYPRYTDQEQCYERFEDTYGPEQARRTYWRKKCVGEPIEHFVTIGPFFRRLPSWNLQRLDLRLDEATHKDYASKLIPRAVGYSAGLLNYFFRGKMEALNVRSVNDASGNCAGMTLKIKNMMQDETMGPGKFVVSYQYRNYGENSIIYGKSNEVESVEDILFGGTGVSDFNFTFDRPIPADASEVKYLLVFRGILGNEEGAVATSKLDMGEYIFLANAGQHNVRTYGISISDGSYHLAPSDNRVRITYSTDNGIWGRNLTVQSNPGKTEHYAVLPLTVTDFQGKPVYVTYNGSISNYGVATYCDWLPGYTCDYAYYGSPNYYRPKDFTQGSPYVLGTMNLHFSAVKSYPIASGRRPYITVDGVLAAKDISLWQGNEGLFMRHRDANDHWIDGPGLSSTGGTFIQRSTTPVYSAAEEGSPDGWTYFFKLLGGTTTQSQNVNPVNYVAVADADKTLRVETDSSDITGYSVREGSFLRTMDLTYEYRNNWCARSYTIRVQDGLKSADIMTENKKTVKSKLMLGDTILDEFELDSSEVRSGLTHSGTKSLHQPIADSNPACYLYDGQVENSFSKESSFTGDTVTVLVDGLPYESFTDNHAETSNGRILKRILDYDHKDGDKIFVVLYEFQEQDNEISSRGLSHLGYYNTDGWGQIVADYEDLGQVIPILPDGVPNLYANSYKTAKTNYALVYKINNTLNKIYLEPGFTEVSSSSGSWSRLTFNEDAYSYDMDLMNTADSSVGGERVEYPSVQIADDKMVYTFVVEAWDSNTQKWVFEKRIVGVINISNTALSPGHRQEFELSAVTGFDQSAPAAIGVGRP